MKIARWYHNNDIRIEEVKTPKPGSDEMLVKIMSCGICGSDIVEWYRLPRAPLVPGHEIGAEVVEIGNDVDKFKISDRVFIAPKVPCMECMYCLRGQYAICSTIKERLPGGFSEYVLVPHKLIKYGTYKLPKEISYDQSTFIEPLACVTGAQRLAKIKNGDTVMIIGCGASGLLHIQLAKSKNCKIIALDINPKKLEYAQKYGVDAAFDANLFNPEQIIDSFGRKVDVILLCTSALSAIEQAWQSIDKGGTIVFFSVPDPDKVITLPINEFWTKEIKIITSYYCGPPDITDAIDLIRSRTVNVDEMITHRFNLVDIVGGFNLVTQGQKAVKVLINPFG